MAVEADVAASAVDDDVDGNVDGVRRDVDVGK